MAYLYCFAKNKYNPGGRKLGNMNPKCWCMKLCQRMVSQNPILEFQKEKYFITLIRIFYNTQENLLRTQYNICLISLLK